jgi:hypothetical protein
MTGVRLENNVRGAFNFAAGTYGSFVIAASTNSGNVSPTIIPAYNNVLAAFDQTADCVGNASPWITFYDSGTLRWRVNCSGAQTMTSLATGLAGPTPPTNGIGTQGGIKVGAAAGTTADGEITATGRIKSSLAIQGSSMYCLGVPSNLTAGLGAGASLTTGSNDCSFTVTIGTGAGANGTLTFGTSAANAWNCNLTAENSSGVVVQPIAVGSTVTLYRASGTFPNGAIIPVTCSAH